MTRRASVLLGAVEGLGFRVENRVSVGSVEILEEFGNQQSLEGHIDGFPSGFVGSVGPEPASEDSEE